MAKDELQEIRNYWTKKYPHVFISLWSNQDKCKYFGKMIAHDKSIDLYADSIGSLISVGEDFLRRIRM